MRENKITITKSSLAEELGVSVRALYADYISEFLHNFPEFNPAIETLTPSAEIEQLKNELACLKQKNADLVFKNKKLNLDLAATKQRLRESHEEYEYLLGRYQVDVGNKITYF